MGIEGQRPGGAAGRNDRHLPRRNPWLRSQNCIKLLVSSLTPCRWIEQGYWTQFRLVSRGTSQCRCSSSAPNEGCDPVLSNQWAFQPAIQENHSFMLLLDDAGRCACVEHLKGCSKRLQAGVGGCGEVSDQQDAPPSRWYNYVRYTNPMHL